MHNGLSRRDMLSMAGAAGGLALVGGRASRAVAQGGGMRIEQMDAALGNIIATNEPIRQLANGYGSLLPGRATPWPGDVPEFHVR